MKIFIKTFGCRVNQVESEAILEQLRAQNHTIITDFKEADLCILNTCTVTANADKDVEKEMRRITKNNPSARLIVTGCYAMAHKDKIALNFPAAKTVFKADISKELFGYEIDWTVKNHEGHSRAFVKIQDGCDCFCSYCIVPYTRPVKLSKPKEIVLKEISDLVANGYREIVLTGINIGNYLCPKTGADLSKLLPEVLALPGGFRVRFSSIELNTVSDNLIDAMSAGGDKFCNYLHIPLQSGSDAVLKHMRRHYNTDEYFKRVEYIKSRIQDISVFCDIITGYPTETQEDFDTSLAFLDRVGFAGLHVFSYSVRPGTPAGELKQLPPGEIKRRSDILRLKDKSLRASKASDMVGTNQQFLAEEFSAEAKVLSGVSANFQRIIIPGGVYRRGLQAIKVLSAEGELCIGEVL